MTDPNKSVSGYTFSFQTEFGAPGLRRAHVASSFLSLLELKTKDYVELEQAEPYDEILFSFHNRELPPRPSLVKG